MAAAPAPAAERRLAALMKMPPRRCDLTVAGSEDTKRLQNNFRFEDFRLALQIAKSLACRDFLNQNVLATGGP
jgi:hypothetical protein